MPTNDLDNKTARLAIAHGRHPVGSQDKLVKHDVALVGSEQQVTLQQAGGRGPWDACEALYYDGMEIGSSDYAFHPGGESDAPDAFFPSDAAHPGASYVNVRLPTGMAADDRPEQLVGIFRTLKTADYDHLGRQLDSGGSLVSASANPLDHFFYMPNPANVAADYLLRWFGRPATRVNWQAWRDWRDWCWEDIEWDDGLTVRTVKRFECHTFFLPPFRLAQVLDRIAQISCADWQDGGGELRFLTPANRSPVFTIDLAKVAPDSFKTWRMDRREKPREVVVHYRDLDDPLLYPADPVIIPGTGAGEPYVVNMGSSTRSQAERVGYYWRRVLCDAGIMAEIKAAPDTYTLLPADAFLLTHDEVDWTDIPFQLVTKDEHGDDDLGDTLTAQIYPADLYSDTDHGPATTPLPADRPNPYAAPPPVSALTLGYGQKTLPGGDAAAVITGEATFQAFAGVQLGRVWWKRTAEPDSEWALYPLPPFVPEPGTLKAPFELIGVDPGEYDVKVVTYSQAGVSAAFASHPASGVTIQIRDSLLVLIESLRVRSFDSGFGFYVGWIPDPSSAGLALGMHLIRDRQLGEGYEQIATFRRVATGGVTTTALASVADPTAFDSSSTLRVNFQGGAPSAVTQEEARAGANKLLVSGANGVESLNYTSFAPVAGTVYELSGFWRGRDGTDAVAAAGTPSGAGVLAVNDAVQFIKYHREDVGRELLLKAVTFGLEASGVAAVPFTPTGLSQRYGAPPNLTLSRLDGTARAPLLSQWGESLGAELSADERYAWKAWNGGTLLRTHIIEGDHSEPLQAQALTTGEPGENLSLLTIGEDGTLALAANEDEFASLLASQRIVGDSRVSWRLDSRNPPFFLGIQGARYPFDINPAADEITVVDHFFEAGDEFLPQSGIPFGIRYVVNPTSDTFQLAATPGGAPLDLSAFSAGEFAYPGPGFAFVEGVESGGSYYVRPALASAFQVPAVAGAQYAIEMRAGVAYFFLIDQQIPKFVSGSFPTRWPYTVRVALGFLGGREQAAVGVTVRRTNPRSFLYTRGMQGNDSAPTPVRVTVSRLSDFGEGLEAEAIG